MPVEDVVNALNNQIPADYRASQKEIPGEQAKPGNSKEPQLPLDFIARYIMHSDYHAKEGRYEPPKQYNESGPYFWGEPFSFEAMPGGILGYCTIQSQRIALNESIRFSDILGLVKLHEKGHSVDFQDKGEYAIHAIALAQFQGFDRATYHSSI